MTFSFLYGANRLTCFDYRANSGKHIGGRMVLYSSPWVHHFYEKFYDLEIFMIKYQPCYQTPIFSQASKLPLEERLVFLNGLKGQQTYRPDYNDKIFSDTLNICVDTSGLEPQEFSSQLGVRAVLFKRWLKGQSTFLPFPLPRRAYALTAIDVTLLANGWIGSVPEPPIRDDSNISHFPKRPGSPKPS